MRLTMDRRAAFATALTLIVVGPELHGRARLQAFGFYA
jgi:hypothetical protein